VAQMAACTLSVGGDQWTSKTSSRSDPVASADGNHIRIVGTTSLAITIEHDLPVQGRIVECEAGVK
jgi:hypothetical protein